MSVNISVVRFTFKRFNKKCAHHKYRDGCEEIAKESNGNKWILTLSPLITIDSQDKVIDSKHFMISLKNLVSKSNGNVFGVSFIVRDAFGGIASETSMKVTKGEGIATKLGTDRSEITDETKNILVRGDLIIDVELQYQPVLGSFIQVVNPMNAKMLQVLSTGEYTDVVFTFNNGKTQRAHKTILDIHAPLLGDFCQRTEDGKDIEVPIQNISPKIFHRVLKYIYGAETPKIANYAEGRDLIDAANRFGLSNLKVAVETVLVESFVFTIDTVVDTLIFAEAKTCPLLKESALLYISARAGDVTRTASFPELAVSHNLMAEILQLCHVKPGESFYDPTRIEMMSVNNLRKKLLKRGLEIDGTKESLAEAVKYSKSA
jgi:hypothetical protein